MNSLLSPLKTSVKTTKTNVNSSYKQTSSGYNGLIRFQVKLPYAATHAILNTQMSCMKPLMLSNVYSYSSQHFKYQETLNNKPLVLKARPLFSLCSLVPQNFDLILI